VLLNQAQKNTKIKFKAMNHEGTKGKEGSPNN